LLLLVTGKVINFFVVQHFVSADAGSVGKWQVVNIELRLWVTGIVLLIVLLCIDTISVGSDNILSYHRGYKHMMYCVA
jgi:purine-cytosine permease-like protein